MSHDSFVQCWSIIFSAVFDNKQHHDGTPMLANNVSSENADRLLGGDMTDRLLRRS